MFITILFSACSQDPIFSYYQEENGKVFDEKYSLQVVDSVRMPLSNEATFWQYSSHFTETSHQKTFYSFLNTNNNTIEYHQVDEMGDIPAVVPLEVDGENGVGKLNYVCAHLFLNPDSIFIYNINTAKLFLVDTTGTVKRKYTIKDYYADKNTPSPRPSDLGPIQKLGNALYFSCSLYKFPGDLHSNHQVVLTFDLVSEKTNYIFPFPKSYDQGFWGSPFKYICSLEKGPQVDRYFVSFPIDPYIYESDLNGRVLNKYYIGSKYFDEIPALYSNADYGLKKNRDFEKEDIYSLSTPDFVKLIYDKYRNVYYRLTYLRPDKDEVKKGNSTPDFTIIICNTDFQKVGEVFFDGEKYNNSMISVARQGLAIARKDLYKRNDDYISYNFFDLVSIES
ncbi:MAG: DUF4221 family protein [Bacteroidota bacterium]